MAENPINESGSSSEETAENGINESGSSSKETETQDGLSETTGRRESVSEDEQTCEDRGSSWWIKGLVSGLQFLAGIVLEAALGNTVHAIGVEDRNLSRNRIARENAASGGTTATDSGPTTHEHQNGAQKEHRCTIL